MTGAVDHEGGVVVSGADREGDDALNDDKRDSLAAVAVADCDGEN